LVITAWGLDLEHLIDIFSSTAFSIFLLGLVLDDCPLDWMEVDYRPTSVQARVLPAPTVILLPYVMQFCFVFANVMHFLIIITMLYFLFL
jgi:hypothetical protein